MNRLLLLIADLQILIYLGVSLSLLFAGRWFVRAWMQRREAVFGLEREISLRRLTASGTLVALILMIGFSEFFLANFIAPSLPAVIPTPTINLLINPTATLDPEMTAQVTQAVPPPGSTGCVIGALVITSPAPGDRVSGEVTIRGTVSINNFGFYKYEVAPAGGDIWSTISAGRSIVVDGELGFWNTAALTPGDYELRLIVTDNKGNALPPCVIPIRVAAP
jgi:hypothetical protein